MPPHLRAGKGTHCLGPCFYYLHPRMPGKCCYPVGLPLTPCDPHHAALCVPAVAHPPRQPTTNARVLYTTTCASGRAQVILPRPQQNAYRRMFRATPQEHPKDYNLAASAAPVLLFRLGEPATPSSRAGRTCVAMEARRPRQAWGQCLSKKSFTH